MAKQSRSLSSLSLYDLPDRPIDQIWRDTHHRRTRLVCKQARDSIDAYYWSNYHKNFGRNKFLILTVRKKDGYSESVAVTLPFVLPRELGCNKNIWTLCLKNTAITDISPLANLTQLILLNLSNTQVSDISALKKLKQLAYLNLGNTPITDISPFAGLTQLTMLDLHKTAITDISALVNLEQLTKLYLGNTAITNLSALAKLKQLAYLFLNNTEITDISALVNLVQLQMLNLSNTKIKCIPDQLMTNIIEIDVHNCPDLIIQTYHECITGYKWN